MEIHFWGAAQTVTGSAHYLKVNGMDALEGCPLKENIDELISFYTLAEKRDAVMIQNLKDEMEDKGLRTAVLLAGGYHREGIIKNLKEQGISFVSVQPVIGRIKEDGLYHDVVDSPDTFVETNLSQMLAYSIYRGVSEKWLDGSYLEFAGRMREAAHGKVDEFGLVQGVCGSPTFNYPGTATEGQAFFLLMEAAYNALEG